MAFSVVVPTCNRRDQLAACLDALADTVPEAEVIVVNGPSTDGTSGMVRDRVDVDVILEIADRNINVARNAGIVEATEPIIAFLGQEYQVGESWSTELAEAVDDGADIVAGPTHRPIRGGVTSNVESIPAIGGRNGRRFSGGNVAMTRETVNAVDGFDEYLAIGGARDLAHRVAAMDRQIHWRPEMTVRLVCGDGGEGEREWNIPFLNGDQQRWAIAYRSLAYRQLKNYGLRPRVVSGIGRCAASDAIAIAGDVLRGDVTPTAWIATGRDVVSNTAIGLKDGLIARRRDPTCTRNPNGLSMRFDRVVERHDRR